MENQQQPSRVRSSLFQAPASAPDLRQDSEPEPQAESVAEAAARPARPRKQPATGRAKKAPQKTLQISLDASAWAAIRFEALKRGTSCSRLVARALAAQYPSVAAASATEAA